MVLLITKLSATASEARFCLGKFVGYPHSGACLYKTDPQRILSSIVKCVCKIIEVVLLITKLSATASEARLTQEPEVPGSIPGQSGQILSFPLPAVVSYWRKYVHLVLVAYI